MPHRLRSILRELDVFVILGALLLVAAIFKASTFYNLSNLFTILELSAVLGIATLGEAMILIVRGVDVSVGAVMGLAGTLSAFLIPDFGLTVSILVPLLVCGLIGLGNGLLVEKGRVPPIVATIGMMWVVSGLAGGVSNGRLIPILDESFQQIALGSAFEIVPLFFVGLIVIGAILKWGITWHPMHVDLQIIGVILMIAGVAGLIISITFQVMRRRQRASAQVYEERRYTQPPP